MAKEDVGDPKAAEATAYDDDVVRCHGIYRYMRNLGKLGLFKVDWE